jgi:pyridoxamine 5'-phosphate oxidase
LNIESLSKQPFDQFSKWYLEASRKIHDDVNAMALATTGKDLKPSARMVLLKSFDDKGFVFFTNYNSRKARDLEQRPYAALLFYWPSLERQIRIEGKLKKLSGGLSDKYFDSRPLQSRISAIVSPQSQIIVSRKILEEKAEKTLREDKKIERPDYWGGYILEASYYEFWQGRKNRLHDRLSYRFTNGKWELSRLAP